MTIEIGLLLSIIAGIIGILGYMANRDRQQKTEAEARGEWHATLQHISRKVDEIAQSLTDIDHRVTKLENRMTAVESRINIYHQHEGGN